MGIHVGTGHCGKLFISIRLLCIEGIRKRTPSADEKCMIRWHRHGASACVKGPAREWSHRRRIRTRSNRRNRLLHPCYILPESLQIAALICPVVPPPTAPPPDSPAAEVLRDLFSAALSTGRASSAPRAPIPASAASPRVLPRHPAASSRCRLLKKRHQPFLVMLAGAHRCSVRTMAEICAAWPAPPGPGSRTLHVHAKVGRARCRRAALQGPPALPAEARRRTAPLPGSARPARTAPAGTRALRDQWGGGRPPCRRGGPEGTANRKRYAAAREEGPPRRRPQPCSCSRLLRPRAPGARAAPARSSPCWSGQTVAMVKSTAGARPRLRRSGGRPRRRVRSVTPDCPFVAGYPPLASALCWARDSAVMGRTRSRRAPGPWRRRRR